MKHTIDSEQLKETSRCLAVSVFLTTNSFVSRAILTVSRFDLSAMYSLYMLYMLYIHTYNMLYTHTHTHTHTHTQTYVLTP